MRAALLLAALLAATPAAAAVLTGSADVRVDCGTNGTDVPTDWYFPSPNPNRGLVWVQHGFSRANNQFEDLSTKLAEQGFVVFATSLAPGNIGCAINNTGFLQDFSRLFPSYNTPGSPLLSSAQAAAAAAGTSIAALPPTFTFSGHSAGGAAAVYVARRLVEAFPATAASLRGLVLLDPVESASDALIGSSLPFLDAKTIYTVSSPPYSCNSNASGTVLLTGLARPFVGVRLVTGSHCDAEGDSTDFLCTFACGTPQAANVSALQLLVTRWTGDLHDGTFTADVYPGGASYESLVAQDRILGLPSPSTCPDGVLDAGEACDDGNTAAGDCCNGICGFEPAGSACAADANPCTDDVCNGAGTCRVPNTAPCEDGVWCNGADTCSGGACTAHAGNPCAGGAECATACDEANERCADPAGTPCGDDGDPCTTDACNGTGACAHPAGNAGVVCRAAAGACDVAEACTGTTAGCPADGFVAGGTTCRAADGPCDVAEACTGSSAACPTDGFVAAGTACPADADVCTRDECDGAGACTHPAGNAGTVCRASTGVCDPAETCTGTTPGCPANAFAPASTVCRAAAGACDVAESCTGASAACPPDGFAPFGTACPDDGSACTTDACNGIGACVHQPGNAGVVCRAAAGACDLAEACDGFSGACPPDTRLASGTPCRAAAGPCDVAESCDGAAAACPADMRRPAGTACADDGLVCTRDVCDGAGVACTHPAGNAGVVCRAASGACDVAEACTGSSPSCPADTGLPDGDGDGVCDAQDRCPSVSDPAQTDGDGDGLGDACDPCTGTAFVTRARLAMKRLLAPGGDDQLALKGDLQLPFPVDPPLAPQTNGFRLLVADAAGAPVVDVAVPGGAYDPVTRRGWLVNGSATKWTFKSAAGAGGITKVSVARRSSPVGLVRLSVTGKTGAWGMPPALPLRATVVLDPAGQCGATAFAAGTGCVGDAAKGSVICR